MNTSKKIAILGAGLLGRYLAVSLSREACQVSVFEKGSENGVGSAAYVAASMLAPLAEAVGTEPSIVRMGYYSLPRWSAIIDSMTSPVFFQQKGSLLVWHHQDQSSSKYFKDQLQAICAEMSELPRPQFCDQEDLMTLEPQLSEQFQQGIFLPDEGQLDNRECIHALLLEAMDAGVQFHWNTSVDLASFPVQSYDLVIDCRGLGSKKEFPELRGVRGEVLRVYAPEVDLTRPIRLIHPKYPLYIAPKRDHLYVIGATEIESEDDSPMSVRSNLELLSAAYTVHSGFAEARILESNAQCRPTLKNNLPSIHQVGKNILQVNGLYRHGFLITPAIVDATVAIAMHQDTSLAHTFDLIQQEVFS
jgi:glycine oxidase